MVSAASIGVVMVATRDAIEITKVQVALYTV